VNHGTLNLSTRCLPLTQYFKKEEKDMAGSTYKIIELVGTSDKSWEEAAKTAIETAGKTLNRIDALSE
jgi:hypothetical protein